MNKNKNKHKNTDDELELYTETETDAIEEHIEKNFGKIKSYFSEKESENIRVNINLIPPSKERPFYILVSSGVGAHKMNVPAELEEKHLERAEFIICLPPDSRLDEDHSEYKWALNLISIVARLPIREDAWLGWGHTIDYGDSFFGDDGFNSVIIIYPMFDEEAFKCTLPDGETVNFYQIMPLYKNELEFKNMHGASALMRKFDDDDMTVADPMRKCVIADNFKELLDAVETHSSKIPDKKLDLLEINGANHISAFLRWSLEHDMLDSEFLDFFAEDIEQIRNGTYDIRKFLINSLDGELTTEIYNETGKEFCRYYYDRYHDSDEPCYPRDVDRMAMDYFGEEKYNCDEFQDEAYLFVPFDENYYTAISRYIDDNYADFLDSLIIDNYHDHAVKIDEKGLETDRINAVNHIAVFIEWCIKHELMSDDFMKLYAVYENDIESGKLDIRDFIINQLDGKLSKDMLCQFGEFFAHFYYSFTCEPPSYPDDVDNTALAFFGKRKYNSKKFQKEAYLFMPFDDNYRETLEKCIDRAYNDFCYFVEHGVLPDDE